MGCFCLSAALRVSADVPEQLSELLCILRGQGVPGPLCSCVLKSGLVLSVRSVERHFKLCTPECIRDEFTS